VPHKVADEPWLVVEELGNGVLEMEGDKLGRKATHLRLDLHPALRPGTAILAPTHQLWAEINAAVRHGLEDERVLHGPALEIERYLNPALEIERYLNLHLTRMQKGDIANYRAGDIAVFHHDVYGVRTRAGDACRVADVDAAEGRVALTFPDGRERRIDPAGFIRYQLRNMAPYRAPSDNLQRPRRAHALPTAPTSTGWSDSCRASFVSAMGRYLFSAREKWGQLYVNGMQTAPV